MGQNPIQIIVNLLRLLLQTQHGEGSGGVEEIEAIGAVEAFGVCLQFSEKLDGVALAA